LAAGTEGRRFLSLYARVLAKDRGSRRFMDAAAGDENEVNEEGRTGMKTKVTSYAFLLLLTVGVDVVAQKFSAEELARRTTHRRAVEAVIWGMPAVNYDLMYQAMVRDGHGAFNQITYWSRLPDW
jgi:hypothetical protein